MAVLFVPRERAPGERRVAVTPDTVRRLTGLGLTLLIEAGAGVAAGFPDEAYHEAGGDVAADPAQALAEAHLVCRVAPPSTYDDLDEPGALTQGTIVLGFFAAYRNLDLVRRLAEAKVTSLAMEHVPRISRAQRMDALSSQANIAGYRAAVMAASLVDKYFPLLMTAAGTIRPTTVVVLGAGVAGLQAVATARRLGAIVRVSDIREAAREEVESLGGEFIDLPGLGDAAGAGGYARAVGEDFLTAQRRILAEHLAAADAVITTAVVPGRRAPTLITDDMVAGMRPGAVVIDVAATEGGNCALTEPGNDVVRHGVRIVGPTNLPSTSPGEASLLYARNVLEFVRLLLDGAELNIDTTDEIIAGALLTMGGEVRHEPTARLLEETG